MSFNIERFEYEAWIHNFFENLNEFEYTVVNAIRTMGWFKKEKGNNICNDKTVGKVMKRIQKHFIAESTN